MVQTRLHKHSLSKAEQAVSNVASRASVRDPIDEFQDVYGSRAASAAFRQQIGSDFSRSGQIQQPIQAKPSFRGLSQELGAESQPVQLREDENKTGLPDDLKAGVEALSGFSMDDVRVHYNSSKPAQLQALAYTQGTEIHVGPGQEKHLAHEAWHVVQQMQGRVKPTMQMKGIDINDDQRLEQEADVMSRKSDEKQDAGEEMKIERSYHQGSFGRPVTLQRLIQGKGGINGVKQQLKSHETWKRFVDTKSKKATKYLEELEKLLDDLHNNWEYGFDPNVIAEAIRLNEYNEQGLEAAKRQLVSPIEERIDEEVLSGGHSGEKHYGKDEKYQHHRMEKEKKDRVTTIHDKAKTRTFFTTVKNTVKQYLMVLLIPLIDAIDQELSSSIEPTRQSIRPVAILRSNDTETFKQYLIRYNQIIVNARNGGGITLRVVPILESLATYPKTESTITMYWGGNSPQIEILAGDNFNTIYEKFKRVVIAPVTAF
jgi:hypothetical protein